ncbi:glutathione S-transferase N-terminal domain-containing protein [uncultured Roseovarius sp.]|uniref:glutathione S-transferase N-terminal domain-containing protein n=1 Tax=uncultured Roseovarius sp. TaxID=293344 RepID=UPI0025E154A0|nr:glutathione S-transferase N-terminal domain-containing protein [uncultured Roseovarius sp.]
MTYQLILGDFAYSSWSLRGWLLLDRFGLPYETRLLDFNAAASVADQLADVPPARTVPTLITPEGAVVSESLAMAEELASRHPEAGLWPGDPLARATARTLAAEMHAGFTTLRNDCPMNMRLAYRGVSPSAALLADLARLDLIWDHARSATRPAGPWLCGDYSAADAFFAPVAARIAGYSLPVSDSARAYVTAHLNDPAFRRWRAMGLVHGGHLDRYARDHATTDWPGPAPRPAKALDTGTPENDRCPYSGNPVTHLMQTEGRIFGFCNAFCRDKTTADPDAWPAFTALRDAN